MAEKKYLLFPEREFYSIPALEKKLKFRYLDQIAFESDEGRQDIFQRGKQHKVSRKAIDLGRKYRSLIESSHLADVSIRWIGEKVGYGLFAESPIAKGDYVGEYTGVVRKNDRRYFEPLNNYCYEYPVQDSIGRSFVTDATQGNLVRFINHSYRPNLQPLHAFLGGFYHLILIALRDIEKGEQISYEYGARYWYLRRPPQDL